MKKELVKERLNAYPIVEGKVEDIINEFQLLVTRYFEYELELKIDYDDYDGLTPIVFGYREQNEEEYDAMLEQRNRIATLSKEARRNQYLKLKEEFEV